jgi:hypothetical protein
MFAGVLRRAAGILAGGALLFGAVAPAQAAPPQPAFVDSSIVVTNMFYPYATGRLVSLDKGSTYTLHIVTFGTAIVLLTDPVTGVTTPTPVSITGYGWADVVASHRRMDFTVQASPFNLTGLPIQSVTWQSGYVELLYGSVFNVLDTYSFNF